ncbi:MAG: HipA N-terminal domain-containing protein, partial [Tabrizicola sp.]|uniref:HipA N-terminal domain-containing protein n=1 Tax=Tabrizicola sp. TaxID=2005166 RepID=UPI003BB17C4F
MARASRTRPGVTRNKTVVWFERARVGTLTKASDGGVSFSYDPAWLASDTAFPVASALSLT